MRGLRKSRKKRMGKVRRLGKSIVHTFRSKSGMEMVQVAILIALAVALGIIFRTEITEFVNNTFRTLNG